MIASPSRVACVLPGFGFAPYRLSGVVYEALLNDPAQLAALGDAAHQPPHKAPPQAPVLGIKPPHTLAAAGGTVVVPAGAAGLVVGATLGIVIGQPACRVPLDAALGVVAGYLLACELSVPLASHYRPAVRQRAQDGFCRLGAQVVPASALAQPDALAVQVAIGGVVVQHSSTGGRLRGVAQLIADVTDFMTLQPGDLLLLGAAHAAPMARVGQAVHIQIAGLGDLAFGLVAGPDSA